MEGKVSGSTAGSRQEVHVGILTDNSNPHISPVTQSGMTKMIPADIPVTASTASTSDEAVVPTATSYITIPTINGVLDLSPSGAAANTFIGSNLVITQETLSSMVQDLSSPTAYFTFSPSYITDTNATILTDTPIVTSTIDLTDDTSITPDTAVAANYTIPSTPENVTSPSPSSKASSILNGDEEERMDPKVVQAAYSAAQSGLLTPLIKEELRCTIQTKRLQKGECELVVEEEPYKEYELTADDEERINRRRERNKVAAQKCRNKRRNKMDSLEKETLKLENSNSSLKKQIKQLELEKQKLALLLQCHDTSFHNCPQNRKLSTSEEEANSWNLKAAGDNTIEISTESIMEGFQLTLSDHSDDSSQDDLYLGQEIEVMDLSNFDMDVATTK